MVPDETAQGLPKDELRTTVWKKRRQKKIWPVVQNQRFYDRVSLGDCQATSIKTEQENNSCGQGLEPHRRNDTGTAPGDPQARPKILRGTEAQHRRKGSLGENYF
ncbi:hypothetical protein HPB52_013496 [Rhipicephalus sanguineus]|uniref:Uncharacterized protein n=1 Tax=Rhipicephalus sanguineus TaxID=34632 RepID=A0A9D4Q9A0_RHISA|nr:hypothetical protein HPB52_013496 [Rhipicephalus sanguineus]